MSEGPCRVNLGDFSGPVRFRDGLLAGSFPLGLVDVMDGWAVADWIDDVTSGLLGLCLIQWKSSYDIPIVATVKVAEPLH